MSAKSLTPKQELFVMEYLVDLNASAAAKRAGYSERRSGEIGYQLLQKTTIQQKIQEEMLKRSVRTQVTGDKVIKELAKIAFSNGTDFARIVTKTRKRFAYDANELKDGSEEYEYADVDLIPTEQLDADKCAAISEIGFGKSGVYVKSYDKIRALELLGKHLGLFDGREEDEEDIESEQDKVFGNAEED